MQNRKGSATEVATNLAIGYSINFFMNLWILPAFGLTGLTIRKNLEMGIVFTVISILRQYLLRRAFNKLKLFEVKC